MIITEKDTIKSVVSTNEKLFSLSIDMVVREAEKRSIPKYLKIGRNKIKCRSLEHISFAELEEIEIVKGNVDYFFKIFQIMLGVTRKQVTKLRFIDSMCYFLSVISDLKKCAEQFAKLDIPLSDEEKQAQYRTRSLGMYDILSAFCKIMPQYKLEEAKQLQWTVIFIELEKNKAVIMTERNMAKIQQQKNRR